MATRQRGVAEAVRGYRETMADEATPRPDTGPGTEPARESAGGQEAGELPGELRRDLDAVREQEDPLSLGDPAEAEIVREIGESGGPRGL